MRALPPLDLHAHVDTSIEASELSALQAIVFAVTRTGRLLPERVRRQLAAV